MQKTETIHAIAGVFLDVPQIIIQSCNVLWRGNTVSFSDLISILTSMVSLVVSIPAIAHFSLGGSKDENRCYFLGLQVLVSVILLAMWSVTVNAHVRQEHYCPEDVCFGIVL